MTHIMAKKNQSLKYPPLRFPEFKDEWKEVRLGEVADYVQKRGRCRLYLSTENMLPDFQGIQECLLEQATSGILFQAGDVLVSNIRPYLRKAWLANKAGCCSADVLVFRHKSLLDPMFFYYIMANQKFIDYMMRAAKGVKMPRGDKGHVIQYPLRLPSLPEQRKIAALLSVIDERIETQSAVIRDQEALKGVLSKRLLTPEEDWMELAIRDCLTYEQPTKYIVRSTAYSSDSTLTPVLTENKGFILGYTNEQETYQKGACIIFDDFTLNCKYVPFVFKVKSSAIKILQAKEGFDIRFMFEVIKSLSLSPLAHKRHYISEVEPIKVLVPSFAKQEKIVRLFTALDERLAVEQEYAALLQKQKVYLLRQMFV